METTTKQPYRTIGSILTTKNDGILSKTRVLALLGLMLFFVILAFIAITVL
ncbi:MAG TPA: hypothetical protein VK806_11240 [Bacteroidia bacterium]|jgi:hypothetical protein|nr:hypothetical protein [Bacteroidia bacterium]